MSNNITLACTLQILSLREFWAIYCCITRQAELQRLIHWAEKKGLRGPLKCYQSRLEDEMANILLSRSLSPPHTHGPLATALWQTRQSNISLLPSWVCCCISLSQTLDIFTNNPIVVVVSE